MNRHATTIRRQHPRLLRLRAARQNLPPASRVATLTGPGELLEAALGTLQLPAGAEVLGPVEVEEDQRYVIRVPRTAGAQLSSALQALQAQRSARKEPHLRVDVDPAELG